MNGIPNYATGIQRMRGRVIGLNLHARAEAPTSRPSKTNDRSIGVDLNRRDDGSITLKAERGSRLVFEPGALQQAVLDLERGEV